MNLQHWLGRVRRIGGRLVSLHLRSGTEEGVERGAGWYDRYYASSAGYHCPYPRSHYYFMWAVIVDRIRRGGYQRILEIGCGPGQLATFLKDQGIREYVGLDFSPTAIALAKENVPGGRFLVGDARTSEIYREYNYDLLLCTEVLEHIQEDLGVIANIPSEKRCICSVPNFPFESHVRHFRNAGEVADRYSKFFRAFDVFTLPSPCSPADAFYLFEGVRNDLAGS